MIPEIPRWRLAATGDRCLIVELGDAAPAIQPLADRLAELALPGVLDIVPALATVAVHFTPGALAPEDLAPRVAEVLAAPATWAAADARLIEVPVCYEAEFGPDLPAVAAACGCTPAEVLARHTAAVHRVAMLGFAPGFPYLTGLDPMLNLPRRATPRTQVPAGSVAIAGVQTGIYPIATPGGWHLLGRTPLRLFDVTRSNPFLLAPGDRVRFVSISAADFRRAADGEAGGTAV